MERRGWFVIVAALVAAVGAAGCITADDLGSLAEEARASTQDGTMTVETAQEEDEGIDATAPPFYATRIVTISGEITLDALPVDLSTINGPILVDHGPEDAYELEVTLTGYGLTPEQAEDQRDRLHLDWSAGTPGDRELVANVHLEDDASFDEGRAEGEIVLTVPRSLDLALSTSTVNGPTTLGNVQALTVFAHSTNGELAFEGTHADRVQASTTNGNLHGSIYDTSSVSLSSTNGDVDVRVHPGATGSITASTTNGALTLAVPEAHAYGYDALATSTNGFVDIRLEDGTTHEDSVLVPQRAQFTTTHYDARTVRTDVMLSSTNGNIVLEPT